ncbi:MAG: capsule biosynthesis protein [Boseongicola sp.]
MARELHDPATRRFLFLQGPHGPFFSSLAGRLRDSGAAVSRVGFNRGDAVFWRHHSGFHAYHGASEAWENWLRKHVEREYITDIVCYGASRPIHVAARSVANDAKLTVHAFEEGYLRPYWVTYERDGTNADSTLINLSLGDMRKALDITNSPLRAAPDRWGDMRQHVFWGAVYHALLLSGRRSFPAFRSHRQPGPEAEFALYLRHLLSMPARRIRRRISTFRVTRGSFPYHVVLLQLAHDANFRDNSNFQSQSEFLSVVFKAFASGAPRHHHLVVKAHPLEDGREPLLPLVKSLASEHGISGRVDLITGGKLAKLLDDAESAVTVNSTAAEQALWRGLPLKAFGRAVYDRTEFVSDQSLADFFASPKAPDSLAYQDYRRFLLQTSQIPGGYYSQRGRRRLLRRLPDLMLAKTGPYENLQNLPAAATQHLRAVP